MKSIEVLLSEALAIQSREKSDLLDVLSAREKMLQDLHVMLARKDELLARKDKELCEAHIVREDLRSHIHTNLMEHGQQIADMKQKLAVTAVPALEKRILDLESHIVSLRRENVTLTTRLVPPVISVTVADNSVLHE